MKNILKIFGSIAFLVIVEFSLLACKDTVNPGSGFTPLSGTVSISGIAQVGQVLTADTTNLGGSGVINFQWQKEGNVIGSNNSAYTVQVADVSSTITVTVTRSDNSGSITSSPTAPIASLTTVVLNDVIANGSSTQTTTQLTLTFSQSITGLSTSDITLSGVSGVIKEPLSGSGAAYTLPISGFTSNRTLNVAVAKAGYTITGSPKTVAIYYNGSGDNDIKFFSLPSVFNKLCHRVNII